MRKTPSLKQIEANRNNARKSTGPKTPQGKAIARMNALKHGLLARQVVAQGMRIRESRHEFRTLHAQCCQHLAPVGPLEEMLVEQIVTTHWRLRRVLTAERGEIELSVDGGWWHRKNPDARSLWLEWQLSGNMIFAMRQSALGIACQISFLEEVRDDVKEQGELTEDALNHLRKGFREVPNTITDTLAVFLAMLTDNPEGLAADVLKAKHRQLVGDYIEKELSDLRFLLGHREEREEKEEEARQAAAVLPSANTLDKILRYETALRLQLCRAMHQLERLQRMRNGEPVPPPLTLEMPHRN